MKRKLIFGLVAAAIAWPLGALGGFGIFQVSGPSALPPGVTLLPIDGGATYYGTNGFTVATASHAFGGVTYAQGWDDPKFFPIGQWLNCVCSQTDADRWIDLGINVMAGATSNQSFSLLNTNGIYILPQSTELFNAQSQPIPQYTGGSTGNGFLGGNGGALGAESPGILTVDEPATYMQGFVRPMDTVSGGVFTGSIFGYQRTLAGSTPLATASGSNIITVHDALFAIGTGRSNAYFDGTLVNLSGASTFNNINANVGNFAASVLHLIVRNLGTNPLTTSNGSATVTVTDTAHGLANSDSITIAGATTFNNVTLNGVFTVAVINANSYTVTAGTTANAAGSGGGTGISVTDNDYYTIASGVRGLNPNPFITTASSTSVHVLDPNHGLSNGNTVTFANAVAFNNVTMNGAFTVTVIDTNNYTVTAGTTANASGPGGGPGAGAPPYVTATSGGTSANATGTGGGSAVVASYGQDSSLNVTAITSGEPLLDNTAWLTGTGLPAATIIVSYGSGQGTGIGTYQQIPSNAVVVPATTITQQSPPFITDTLQSTRFFWTNITVNQIYTGTGWAGKTATPNGRTSGGFNATVPTSPSSTQRHTNLGGFDFYFIGGSAKNLPPQFPGQFTASFNISGNPSFDRYNRGSYYGDSQDMFRLFQTANASPWVSGQPSPLTGATAFPAPIVNFLDNGGPGFQNFTQNSYITPDEMTWATWSTIIHGGLFIAYFNSEPTASGPAPYAPFTGGGADNFANNYFGYNGGPGHTNDANIPTSSITGSISGTTLTVTAVPTSKAGFGGVTINSNATLQVPSNLSGTGVTAGTKILRQLDGSDATFTGTITSNVLTISGAGFSGTMTLPCALVGAGVDTSPQWIQDPASFGTIVSAGGGTYNLWYPQANVGSTSMHCYQPGGTGTYLVDKSQTVSSGTMTSTQGASIYNTAKANNTLIRNMAPVIKSQFAKGYVTVSPAGYSFENGLAQVTPGVGNVFTTSGIDMMAKWYTGSPYSTSGFGITTDTITPTFYIFATTRNSQTAINTSATFNINDPTATSVTVINEGRSLSLTSVGGGHFTFTDTFAYAWTVHIYRINH